MLLYLPGTLAGYNWQSCGWQALERTGQGQVSWLWILALPPTDCVTLGKSLSSLGLLSLSVGMGIMIELTCRVAVKLSWAVPRPACLSFLLSPLIKQAYRGWVIFPRANQQKEEPELEHRAFGLPWGLVPFRCEATLLPIKVPHECVPFCCLKENFE